jgi:hypothetical protein
VWETRAAVHPGEASCCKLPSWHVCFSSSVLLLLLLLLPCLDAWCTSALCGAHHHCYFGRSMYLTHRECSSNPHCSCYPPLLLLPPIVAVGPPSLLIQLASFAEWSFLAALFSLQTCAGCYACEESQHCWQVLQRPMWHPWVQEVLFMQLQVC